MSDISSIYTSDTKLLGFTKDANIFIVSIPRHLCYSKTVFSL